MGSVASSLRSVGRRAKRSRSQRVARLTQRGWAMLIIGAVVIPLSYWLGRREMLYLGSFLILMPVLALAFVRLRRSRLAVTRTFTPSIVSAGHPAVADVQITNLSKGSTIQAHWRDSWPWYPYSSVPSALPIVRGAPKFFTRRASVTLRYALQPNVRGVYGIGPILVDFTDPFGLADGAFVAGATTDLTVTPDVVPLADNVVSITAEDGTTRMLQRRATGGEDDLMTREYRRGDALRRVHWRASAHHGELMVRQEEQRSHAEARLMIDTCRTNYRDVKPVGFGSGTQSESFEWAVEMLASLALHLQSSGFLVQVIETGEQQIGSLERPAEFLESLAALSLLEKTTGDLSLVRGLQRPDRPQGSLFVILSDTDPLTLDRLLTQRRSFKLAVVFLVMPRHRELALTLRAAGWIVVICHPGQRIEDAWIAVGAEQESTHARA